MSWQILAAVFGLIGNSNAAELGWVLDADSGAAVPGAVAVVWWTRQIDADSPRAKPECLAIRTVTPDDLGGFALPTLQSSELIASDTKVQRHVYAFKNGYREHSQSYDTAVLQAGIFYLQPDDFSAEMRMDYLLSVLAKLECPRQAGRKFMLRSLLRDLHAEAQDLRSQDDKQQYMLDQIERRIAYVWSDEKIRQPQDQMTRYFRETVARELVAGEHP